MNEFPKEKLLNLDDESFKSLIYEINAKAGGNPAKAEKLASDIPSLKKQIGKMSSHDAEKLMNRLSQNSNITPEEILKKLNGIG